MALDAPSAASKPALELRPRASKKSCNDCNRQFCLAYSFCKGEKDENVFTTCFQRDSTKDQVVVLVFIAATVGLLGYAGMRPWVDQWREVSNRRLHHGLSIDVAHSAEEAICPFLDKQISRQPSDHERDAMVDTNVRDTQRKRDTRLHVLCCPTP